MAAHPSEETTDEETRPGADRPPTEDEERLADRSAEEVDVERVGEHHREMTSLGASIEGEGRIGG